MQEFPAEVYGGGRAMVVTLLVGLGATGALAGACHLLGLPSEVLGGVFFVGVIGTQLMVMLGMRKRPAVLAFEGQRLVLRAGRKELRAATAGGRVGLARYVVPQIGVMGQALVLGQPAELTIGVMRSNPVAAASAADVSKPDCFVTAEAFDRLATMVAVPPAHIAAANATPTRFELFANKSSTGYVMKAFAYMWLVVMPVTGVAAYLADRFMPSPLSAAVAVVALLATGGAGIAMMLQRRERTIAIENGSLIVADRGRVLHSALLAAVAVKRVQHDVRAKSMRWKLTGISLRFPDGSEITFASRVPGVWQGGVDEIRRGEPGWLMGPAELPVFARRIGIRDTLTEGY